MTSEEGNHQQLEPEFINLAEYIRARRIKEWQSITQEVIAKEQIKRDRTQPFGNGNRVCTQAAYSTVELGPVSESL